MSSSHGRAHGRRRTHKPPHGTPKEEDDNPYFASVGIAAATPSSPPLPLPRPASPSRQSPSRQSPARQSPARLSPRQLRNGGGSGPAKPPTSRARLLKEAEAEEERAAAAREEEQGRARRAGEKLLQLKSQRAQVESKLAEWEATFRRTHERDPASADRQRSSQHKELTKLIADLDRFISAAETGAAPPGLGAAGAQLAGEREAERGKLKAKMRRWDRDFERERGRRPREEDRAASEEFLGLRSRLQVLDESGDVSNRSNASNSRADGGGLSAAAAAAAGSDGLFGAALGGLGGVSEAAHRLNPGGWWGGGEYYQIVISRVTSREAAHGFDQEPPSELRSAAAMFVQYDMDRDGVIGFQEFLLAMTSLAQRAGRSLSTARVQKLFNVADLDSNGAVDFGEFLLLEQKKKSRSGGAGTETDDSSGLRQEYE